MRVSKAIRCRDFPCTDVNHECYLLPNIDVDPNAIDVIMISEAVPPAPRDYYYAGESALFAKTTVLAFQDAGLPIATMQDIFCMGVYLTTAVKCGKIGYGIESATIEKCSSLLEKELALFPNVKAFMLMGDVAIKSANLIAKRAGQPRVFPAGPTYKIRSREYFFCGKRAFPSYLQAGPSFFIEKRKRRMIAEDIQKAMALVRA